jgi:hypothetical protein
MNKAAPGLIGHNSQDVSIRVEVRLFNSLSKYSALLSQSNVLEFPAGARIGDVVDQLKLPAPEVFLVLLNGRDVTPGPYQGGVINRERELENGDVVAFSGPVPYSYGYGSPVV